MSNPAEAICLDGTTSGDVRPISAQPDDALTTRTRAVWTAGDFDHIARSFARGAAAFIGRLRLAPGERVLDVACGTGNLALPAALAGARVTGLDIAANLLATAAAHAAEAGLDVALDEGNAECLPYADGSFGPFRETPEQTAGSSHPSHPSAPAIPRRYSRARWNRFS